MIRYERLESHEGAQHSVRLITDDSEAEMAKLQEMIAECELDDIELPKDRNESGYFSFIIPGPLVGDFSDMVWDIDNGQLEELIEAWNRKALAELDES